MDITVAKDFKISITSLYARDGSRNLTPNLESIPLTKHSFIAGDFNAKHSFWGSSKINTAGKAVFDWSIDTNMIIINNKEHTYQSHSTGLTDSMDISMITSDLADRITNWQVLCDTMGSDHFPIVTNIEFPCHAKASDNIIRWNIKKANRDLFKSLIWETADNALLKVEGPNNSLEDRVESFTNCIVNAAKESYPLSKPLERPPAPWWNKEIERTRKVKRRSRRKWKRTRATKDMIAYKKEQAKVRKLIKTSRRETWKKFVSSINRNTPSNVIWRRIKAINGISRTSKTALVNDGSLITDPGEQANLFANYYAGKCSLSDPVYNPEEHTSLENTIQRSLDLLCESEDSCDDPITMSELHMALQELKSSATGEDLIHNQMLQDLPWNGQRILLKIFNEIWETGHYPSAWKISKIIPLLKPNKDKQQIKSYRPVALTSCLGKLFERIINRRLSWKIENEEIFHSSQCGFRPKSGTTDALIKITEQCHEGIHNKMYTVVVLIDLEGAFDKVWWEGLLIKAAEIGIQGNMLKMLRSFLSDRHLRAQVDGETSENFSIGAGTPQGAVLSPTIFNIMMYDLPLTVSAPCSEITYADDGTITLTHHDLPTIVEKLNHCLTAIDKWANRWKLKVSKEKTEYTVITRRRKHSIPVDNLGLVLNGERIKYNKHPKILGLTLDPTLSWNVHIDKLVESCSRRLNLMKTIASNHWGADLSTLRTFYLAYIRSKISYAIEIWSSCSKTQFQRLCKIQNTALRLMTGALRTSPVAALEIEADILPLELLMESIILKKRVKQHFMPSNSPGHLKKSSSSSSFYQRARSLLQKAEIKLPSKADPRFCRTAVTNHEAPWKWSPPVIKESLPGNPTKADTPSLLQQLSLELIHEQYKDSTKIYTDGSLDAKEGRAGAGVYFEETGKQIILPLPPCSILKAELLAIERSLEEIKSDKQCINKSYVILTDSKSSLQSLSSYSPSDYYHHCKSITDLIKEIPSEIILQWIPSHVGIPGNEKADTLAKTASESGPVHDRFESAPSLYCAISQSVKEEWKKRWKQEQTGRSYFGIQSEPNSVRYTTLSRSEQVNISRLKLHHFPCQSYLHRFNLAEDPKCLLCNDDNDSIEHIIFSCPELASYRSYDTTKSLKELMTNTESEWTIISNLIQERKKRIHARAKDG